MPLIPEVVEHDTPALLAYWEVKTLFSHPKRLTNTIDCRAQMKELPMRHFYSLLKAYRDDSGLKEGWKCAMKTDLSARHARDIARKITAGSKEIERVKTILMSLGDPYLMSVEELRLFEDIKRHNPNYHISLVKMARARMDEIKSKCPSLAGAMAELTEALTLKPEDIKEDNELIDTTRNDNDQAPLIAMTLIGVASIILNVLQGIMTARRDYKKAQGQQVSPLQNIGNK